VPATVSLLVLSFIPLFLSLGFLQIVIGAWLVTVGFTAVQAGTLIAAQGMAAIATSIPLGVISDVYGRKHLLTLGALSGALALFAFALTTDFWYLFAISAVLGFTEGAAVTTWNALLADLTDASNRNKVFSLSFVMVNVTTGVGLVLPGAFPALQRFVGLSNYVIHRETLLLLGSASFITPLIIYVLLRRHKETHNPTGRWSGLRNTGTLAKLGFVGSTIGFGAGFIIPLVGAWFFYRFGVGDEFSGPILAFSNILIGFSAVASPRLASRFGQMRAILLTTGSSMLFMLSMAFIPAFALAAGIYIVRSALMNMAGLLIDSFSMSIFPADQRGVVSALSNIMFRLPNSVSTYFGGFILGLGLLQLPFFVASALYIVGACGVLLLLRGEQEVRQRSLGERGLRRLNIEASLSILTYRGQQGFPSATPHGG
jgi:MFS family permease